MKRGEEKVTEWRRLSVSGGFEEGKFTAQSPVRIQVYYLRSQQGAGRSWSWDLDSLVKPGKASELEGAQPFSLGSLAVWQKMQVDRGR